MERHGAEGFTLRAAAKRAGVSGGAPYHHFPDKEALLAAVATAGFDRLYEAMKAAARKQRGNLQAKNRAMGVAYVPFVASNPSFGSCFGRPLGQPEKYPELWESATRTFHFVQASMGSDAAHNEDILRSRRHNAYATWALLHGLSYLAIDGHLGAAARTTNALTKLVRIRSELTFDRPRS